MLGCMQGHSSQAVVTAGKAQGVEGDAGFALTSGIEPRPSFQPALTLSPPHYPDAASVRGRQLLAGLEKVNSDLDKQEKAITANLRPPLEQSRAVQDSTERSKDLKVQGCGSRQTVLYRDRTPRGSPGPQYAGCCKHSLSPGACGDGVMLTASYFF